MSRFTVLATAGLLALTGCGAVHPGAAAVVGHQSISVGQVDALARGLCSANAGSTPGGQPLATRGARQGALQVLLETELSQQFGQQRGVQPSQKQIAAVLARSASTINRLPKDERATFREDLARFWEGQYMLAQIGRKALEAQGKTNVTDSQAIAEGNRLRAQWAKGVGVSVDPRFGTFQRGSYHPATNGGSLSVPASERARAGNTANPSSAWVSGLPAQQQCS